MSKLSPLRDAPPDSPPGLAWRLYQIARDLEYLANAGYNAQIWADSGRSKATELRRIARVLENIQR